MLNEPKINIGLAVYNGENYVRQAIESLLFQTYANLELIISDNASTDKTSDICREYARQDKRVRYYRNDENKGAMWNFARVLDLSTAEYFMWAAHDDFWEPQYVQKCMDAFHRSPQIILAGSWCDWIDGQTSTMILTDPGVTTVGLTPWQRFKAYKMALHNGRNINAIFYGIHQRQTLLRAMPIKPLMCNDHLFLAQMCLWGEFVTVEEALMTKRKGGASVDTKSAAKALGMTNSISIWFPYLFRELDLQGMLWRSGEIAWWEKPKAMLWSWGHYLYLCTRHLYWRLQGKK